MAHGVRRIGRIRVHQALHGYADGHRLLASSVSLAGHDAKTMLVLSDASSSGARIDDQGYLTGYPLPDSGLYALARTWAAPEMSRPGCVWTHTLLIDFADLAAIPAPGVLVGAISRPTTLRPHDVYAAPIELEAHDARSLPLSTQQTEWVGRLLWTLYSRPRERVVAGRTGYGDVEPLVLAIWAQQWPRLRRSFRFCTLAFADRSAVGAAFDLQILPLQERAAHARFEVAVDADRPASGGADWLPEAIHDIRAGPRGGLREFFRRVGGEVAVGREAFVPLCRMHRLLGEFESRPSAIGEAIGLLDGPLAQARTARALVTAEAAARVDALDEDALNFVIRNLNLLDGKAFDRIAPQVGRALWKRDLPAFGNLLNKEGPCRDLADRTLATLTADDLLGGLRRAPALVKPTLARRPDVVTHPAFWAMEGATAAEALAVAAETPERASTALDAMISAGIIGLANQAVNRFGPAPVLAAVLRLFDEIGTEEPVDRAAPWIAAAAHDGGAVAQVLSGGSIRRRSTLVALARVTWPDLVSNDFGEDPWLTALRPLASRASDRGERLLAAYLLGRALGHRSRSQAELIALNFDEVYSAALESRLSDDAWRLVEPRLPVQWFDWDYCRRLRTAVVDAFIERDLSPGVFGTLTSNDSVFAALAERAARTWRGRTFLQRVRRALKYSDRERFAFRIGLLEKLEV
jgi:hypothetical protein